MDISKQVTLGPCCEDEKWAPIRGFEGIYEVSTCARVKRLIDGPNTYAGKPICCTVKENGYVRVVLWKDHGYYPRYVHRLVADAFLRQVHRGEEVNHLDFNPRNNHLGNLEITTPKGNSGHAGDHQRMRWGEQHEWALFTEQDVRRIRELALTMTRAEIARLYGKNWQHIDDIVKRKSWRHLDSDKNLQAVFYTRRKSPQPKKETK